MEDVLSLRSFATVALAIFVALHIYSYFTDRRSVGSPDMSVAKDPHAASRVFSIDDLAVCCGSTETKANKFGFKSAQILLCVNGEVYEATSHPTGREFYGDGKPYNAFAGCDSTVALARVQIDKTLCNTWDWNSLTPAERKALAEWIIKFRTKYVFVGHLKEAEHCRIDLSSFGCPPY